MNRDFKCYAKYMAKSLVSVPGWTNPNNNCAIIRDFFSRFLPLRNRNRFDVFGSQGKGWRKGDRITFVEQKSSTRCAEAVLDGCSEGPFPNGTGFDQGDPNADRHFFLDQIVIK